MVLQAVSSLSTFLKTVLYFMHHHHNFLGMFTPGSSLSALYAHQKLFRIQNASLVNVYLSHSMIHHKISI